jgi:hypothetical protein
MDTESYVKRAAEAIDLEILPERLAGTVLQFERSAALAKLLMEFDLPFESQPAPLFRP